MVARILYIITLCLIALLDLARAWDCSLKCGRDGYEKCMGEKNKTDDKANDVTEQNRKLLEPLHELGALLPEMKHGNFLQQSRVSTNLRGSSGNDTTQRRLSGFDFQIKMYWKEGFCWQEEWREREWCWQCWGSWPYCYEDEKVEIKWCNASIPSQRWVYKPADETYGRFSPVTNETLCFTGINKTSYRLKPCDETNTMQLFSGWSATPKFELIPYGETERCLTQEHDPKNYEEVIAYNCDTARKDKTNYWGISNPSGYYKAPSPMERSEGDEYCVIDLDLMDNLSIRNGAPFTSPDHSNIVMEQMMNGNLVVRDKDAIVWQSGVSNTFGSYYTRLQGDGNMLTFRGEVGEDRDSSDTVWKSRSSASSKYNYFFGLSCDGSYVAIYQGSPNNIQEIIWNEDTILPAGYTLSVADPIVFTPEPSQAPSSTPSEMPSYAPSAMPSYSPTPAPSKAPSASPTPSPTPAPTKAPSASPTPSPTSASTANPTISTPSEWPTAGVPPTPAPTLNPSESPTYFQATLDQVADTTCSSNPACAVHNLVGDCCPTSDGLTLTP